jgi:phospholipase C
MKKLGRRRPGIKAATLVAGMSLLAGMGSLTPALAGQGGEPATATPIEHLVVIFQENVSFDHYFATYPFAANTDGTTFNPAPGTPSVNGLGTLVEGEPSGVLLTNNPNANNPANGSNAINPFRLGQPQASTCDQDHNYGAEQSAFDQGLMDLFPLETGSGESGFCASLYSYGHGNGIVMAYFDGNTVTGLWNYAQNFALSDNFFGTTFGPSTPGALNLVAGNTYPATPSGSTPKVVNISNNQGTIVGDLDPMGDPCASGVTVQMAGKNVGDLLNDKGISWGSFMGGFDLTVTNINGTTGCDRSSPATPANSLTVPPPANNYTNDYIPHHAWFQYWASTANPKHTRPSVPPSQYGTSADQANHEYDIHDFFDALQAGNLPAVSILKAPANMDGHAGYSDPLLEQQFLVNTINTIETSPFWKNTAIVITWDDSDGWYDHQMNPIVNPSSVTNTANQSQDGDNLNGAGKCGNGSPINGIEGRCGYGPRIPLVVISPYAKVNFVDHTLTDQSSILRFIEDNWGIGQIGGGSYDALAGPLTNMFDFTGHGSARPLFLDPGTGAVVSGGHHSHHRH